MASTNERQARLDMVLAVRDFYKAAKHLSQKWHEDDLMNEKYPFNESFEEIVDKIGKWNYDAIDKL